MKIIIEVENANPFQAGWLACHMGLPKHSLKLEGISQEAWNQGWQARQETADMETPDEAGHGGCHIAFLVEAINPLPDFVRHKVSVRLVETTTALVQKMAEVERDLNELLEKTNEYLTADLHKENKALEALDDLWMKLNAKRVAALEKEKPLNTKKQS